MIGILDTLIGNGAINPVIVVKPDGSAPPYWGSFYTNSLLYGNFEDYIVYDLVQFVDANYKTIASRDKRCIIGHSMGGYGSAKLALSHPDIFCAMASHSGPLDYLEWYDYGIDSILSENGPGPPYIYTWNAGIFTNFMFTIAGAFSPNLSHPPYYVDLPLDSNGNLIDSIAALWHQNDATYLASLMPPGSGPAIYFDCGTVDQFLLYPANISFADSLDSLGIDYRFESYYGDHSNQVYNRAPISLAFLDSVMNPGAGSCDYIVGDANYSGGYNGLDITYGVAFFKGGPPPPYVCECTAGNTWYVAGDVNASCSYNGLDITYGVAYFKGGSAPNACPDCPPSG
jgi:S-formylglutathione hydrolase FrmB